MSSKPPSEEISVEDVENMIGELKKQIEISNSSDAKVLVQVEKTLEEDRSRIRDINNKVSAIQKSKDLLKEKNQDLQMSNDLLKSQNAQLQKRIDDVENKYISLKEAQDKLGNKIPKEAQTKLDDLRDRISSLEKEKREAELDKLQSQAKLKALNDKIDSIDKDINETRETFKRIASKELTKAIDPAKAKYDEILDQEFAKLKY